MQKIKLHRPVLLYRATLMGIVTIVAACASLALHPAKADATANSTVNFQARLMTAGGAIVPDGNYNVEFKIYNALSSSGSSQGSCTGDSNCLWTETRISTNQVRVANGYLTVGLGSVTSFPSINWDQNLWLSMRIGGTGTAVWDPEMSPRLALTATPYSFSAGQLANTNGANRSTLTWVTQTASNSIQLPNEGGTLCIQGSANCGFLTTTTANGNYIQNTTSASIQTATIAIQSTSINTTTQVLKVLSGQNNDALDIQDPAGNPIAGIQSSGAIFSAPSGTAIPGNARLFVQPLSSSSTAIIARAAASATADIIDAQDSTGTNTLFSVGATGNVAVKPSTNSTSAFQVQNSSGATVMGVDTTATTNLLSNPDFDLNTTGWTNTTNGALTRQTTSSNAYEGANSGQVVTTGTGGGMKSNGTAAFASGSAPTAATYTLSFFAKLSSGTFTTLSAGYNQGASDVPCTLNSNTVLTTGFQRYSCTFTTTGTMSYVFVTQTDATGRTFYIDGLQLQSGSSATPYQIGGVQLRGIVTSPVAIQGSADSTSAFQIQNATGTSNLFVADTLNSRIGIGTATPTAPLDVVGQINTSVGLSIGGSSVCDTTGSTGCIAKSGSGFYIHNQTTIQTAASMFIQGGSGNVTAVLEANGADILDLKNSSGVNVATFGATGSVLVKTSTDSTSAFQVQQNGSSTPVLNVDTTNARVGIGQATPSRLFDVAQNSSQITAPMALLEQNGTGDATIELKSATSATSFYVGQDTSNSGTFTVNSSTAAASNAITYIQSASAQGDAAVTTIAASYPSSVTTSNLLAVAVTWSTTSSNTLTCSDTLTNTWTTTASVFSTNAGQQTAICWAIAGSSGSDTVTATISGAAKNFRRIVVSEYHNVAASSPVDVSAVSVNNAVTSIGSSGATTSNATTTQSGDLIFSANEDTGNAGNSTVTAGSGFTQRQLTDDTVNGSNDHFSGQDKIQTSPSSVAATWGETVANNQYVAAMIAFKPTAATITDTFNNSLFTLSQIGAAKFTNSTNSTSAFVIQNSGGTQLLAVDSTNSRILVGNGSTGTTSPTVLVLNSKSNTGDPTGVEGAMYYNNAIKSFRCYFNGSWRSCAGGAVYTQTGFAGGDTVANTTAATVLSESYTILGNDCTGGRHYRLTANGIYGTTTGTNNLTLTVKLGSTTMLVTPTISMPASITVNSQPGWSLNVDLQCYSGNPGASGPVGSSGVFQYATTNSGSTSSIVVMPSANGNINGYNTVDTTSSQAVTLTAQWSVANTANNFTLRQYTLEALGP